MPKERKLPTYTAYVFHTWTLIIAGLCANFFELYGEKMLPFYITSATIYIIGKIADKAKTVETFELVHSLQAEGIPIDVSEVNPFISNQPTTEELFSWKKTGIDFFSMPAGILFPPYGIIWGVVHLLAATNNHMLKKKIETRHLKYEDL